VLGDRVEPGPAAIVTLPAAGDSPFNVTVPPDGLPVVPVAGSANVATVAGACAENGAGVPVTFSGVVAFWSSTEKDPTPGGVRPTLTEAPAARVPELVVYVNPPTLPSTQLAGEPPEFATVTAFAFNRSENPTGVTVSDS
jgi:hypothetical protein